LGAGIMSSVTSYVGGELGNTLKLDKLLGDISSPLLRNVLAGQISGTVVGGAFGGINAYANEQPVGQGILSGAKMGLVTGTLGGIGGAVTFSQKNHVNILTGRLKPVYHYTNSARANSIELGGLRPSDDGFTYTTTDPDYTSSEAINALNLRPEGGARDALFKIDAAQMAADGYLPSFSPRPVAGGTGIEVLYSGPIPAKYLIRIK